MIQPPPPDFLPPAAAAHVAEYHRLADLLVTAEADLAALASSMDNARAEDARALADAARAGANTNTVANAAQSKLTAQIHEQQTLVAGLKTAVAETEYGVRQALKAHVDDGLQLAVDRATAVQRDYLAAIAHVRDVAHAYDQALHLIGGWAQFVESQLRDVAWGYGVGSIKVGQHAWLEPVNVDEVTAELQQHAGRHQLIVDGMTATAQHKENERAARRALAEALPKQPMRLVDTGTGGMAWQQGS